MADRLGTIRKLLEHERQDRRCAAAVVLAELGANDSKTVKALVAALGDLDPEVRRSALEALGQLEAAEAVDEMVERLSDLDPRVQASAEAAVLGLGDAAAPALQRMLEGPASSRRAAAVMLSRLQSSAGLDMLVEAVDGNDPTVLERARKALRDRAPELPAAEARALRKRLESRLTQARHERDDALAAAVLLLLGDVPDETTATRIVKESGPEVPAPVRKAALGALSSAVPVARGRRRDAAVDRLVDYLGEDDEEVTRTVLRILVEAELPAGAAERLGALVDAPSASVRAFALGQLGKRGTPESIDTLVGQLLVGAPPVRGAAREALSGQPSAAPRLCRALLETGEAERLREVGDLVRLHAVALPAAEASAVCEAALDRAEQADEAARGTVEAVCNAVPEVFMEALRERVKLKRKRRKLGEAVALLGAVERCPAFGAEERYQLAVLGLARYAEAPASRPLRTSDRVCQPFTDLLRAGFPVESRLAQERLVETRDLYQLGFAFAESRDEDERDLGRDLLEEVVEREPQSKTGAAARNKLKLTGR